MAPLPYPEKPLQQERWLYFVLSGFPLLRERRNLKTRPGFVVDATDMRNDIFTEIYRRLLDAYGPQGWWPGDSRFEMIAGAILTQAAAWRNVELALGNLRDAGIDDWPAVDDIGTDALAELVRPSGYYNAKARKLKAFAAHVRHNYGGNLDAMFAADTAIVRRELLSIYGIGPETADDILVYAAGKPSFVVDAYTIRIMRRVGLTPAGRADYAGWQAMFHAAVPRGYPGVQRISRAAGPAPQGRLR